MLLRLHGGNISVISRRHSHSNHLCPLALTIFLLPCPQLTHSDAWALHVGIELCYQFGLGTTQSFWLVMGFYNALSPSDTCGISCLLMPMLKRCHMHRNEYLKIGTRCLLKCECAHRKLVYSNLYVNHIWRQKSFCRQWGLDEAIKSKALWQTY